MRFGPDVRIVCHYLSLIEPGILRPNVSELQGLFLNTIHWAFDDPPVARCQSGGDFKLLS